MSAIPSAKTLRALAPPASDVTPITTDLVEHVLEGSRVSERRRMILPFHKSHEDSLHRMFNAMQPNTYIQPHRHASPPKDESLLVMRGALCFVTFRSDGVVDQMFDVVAGSNLFGVDIAAGVFHSFIILEPDTVIYEVKPGPYSPIDDKDFATWAPKEGAAEASAYLMSLLRLREERRNSVA